MAGLETALGAILGFAFEQLLQAIKDTKARCNNFKSTLDSLENKINSLTPKIKEMDRLNQKLGEGDNPKEEILLFAQQLEKARKLVALCSNLTKRHIHKKFVYKKRLDELDSSLDKLLIELMAAQAVDVKRIMAEVLEMNKKLNKIYPPVPDAPASDSSSPRAWFKWTSNFDFGFRF